MRLWVGNFPAVLAAFMNVYIHYLSATPIYKQTLSLSICAKALFPSGLKSAYRAEISVQTLSLLLHFL